ncbi:fibronectin type III domain-containing protein [Poriferisphaera sp. WC338]|uniref:fibronectin type III domain-containing protein n=1 Tax=Poriferisphaera sp. WC338 TaxID=3425129 RepID=UPI003D815256
MKNIVLNLLILSFTAIAWGHETHEGLRHWEIASPDPDRIFLSFYGDAATSRAVTWRTDTSIEKAVAQIAESIASPEFDQQTATIEARTETIDLNQSSDNKQGKVNYHSVIFNNLKPDTLYAYRVGDGENFWSEWIQFKTAAATEKPFSFVYFGDAQNGVLSHWSRVIRMAYQKAPDAAFAIHAGDLINHAHRDMEWSEWFKAGGWVHGQWTGIPVLGNHELAKFSEDTPRVVSILWRPQFTLPLSPTLPEELQETVYTVDYQGLRVIVLNSMMDTKAQNAYLEQQLQRPGAKWKVVTCHHSIFSPAKKRNFAYARKAWKPLLDKYGVDLVLQGHDHTYARGHVPVRTADGSYGDSIETMYVTSVSGKKMYDLSREQLESYAVDGYESDQTAVKKQFFQVINVTDNQLIYEAYTADGKLYDKAVITKDFKTGKKTLQ